MPTDIERHIGTIVNKTTDNFIDLWDRCEGDMTVKKIVRNASNILRDKDRKKREKVKANQASSATGKKVNP